MLLNLWNFQPSAQINDSKFLFVREIDCNLSHSELAGFVAIQNFLIRSQLGLEKIEIKDKLIAVSPTDRDPMKPWLDYTSFGIYEVDKIVRCYRIDKKNYKKYVSAVQNDSMELGDKVEIIRKIEDSYKKEDELKYIVTFGSTVIRFDHLDVIRGMDTYYKYSNILPRYYGKPIHFSFRIDGRIVESKPDRRFCTVVSKKNDIPIIGTLLRSVSIVGRKGPGFGFPEETIRRYKDGNCGLLAVKLKEKLGYLWEMYSVFLLDRDRETDEIPKGTVPVHYILGAPEGMFIDIDGFKAKDEVIDEWNQFDREYTAILKPTEENMDNEDYMKYFCDKHYRDASEIVNKILRKIENDFQIMKTSTVDNHPFKTFSIPSFRRTFPTDRDLLNRIACNNKTMSDLGIGPKIYSQEIFQDKLITVTEYLPITVTKSLLEENFDKIHNLIKKMHSNGIYHGDLHGGNIMFTSEGELRIIDWDTLFYEVELDSPLFKEWIRAAFEMEKEEFLDHETNTGWKGIPYE